MVEIPPQQICLPWYLCLRISFCTVNKLWFTVHLLSDTKVRVSNCRKLRLKSITLYFVFESCVLIPDLSQKSLYFPSYFSSLLYFTRMILFTNKKFWLQLNYDSKELITSLCLNWEKLVWCFHGCVIIIIIIIMVFPFSFHRPNTLCPNTLSDSMRILIGEILKYTLLKAKFRL
jgi:hypothetical protein